MKEGAATCLKNVAVPCLLLESQLASLIVSNLVNYSVSSSVSL